MGGGGGIEYPIRGSYVLPQLPCHVWVPGPGPGGGPGGGGSMTFPADVGGFWYLGGGGGMFTMVAFSCAWLGGDMGGGGGGTWNGGRERSLEEF